MTHPDEYTCARCHARFTGQYNDLCPECEEDRDNGVDDTWDDG